MKIQKLLLLLNTSTLLLTLPASGGNCHLKYNWWEGTDKGISGQYLTTKFNDAVIEPAFRTIVKTLDPMTTEIKISNYNDELFLAVNIRIVLRSLFLMCIIHKKISEQQ